MRSWSDRLPNPRMMWMRRLCRYVDLVCLARLPLINRITHRHNSFPCSPLEQYVLSIIKSHPAGNDFSSPFMSPFCGPALKNCNVVAFLLCLWDDSGPS
jgi:hypothetical protein